MYNYPQNMMAKYEHGINREQTFGIFVFIVTGYK